MSENVDICLMEHELTDFDSGRLKESSSNPASLCELAVGEKWVRVEVKGYTTK